MPPTSTAHAPASHVPIARTSARAIIAQAPVARAPSAHEPIGHTFPDPLLITIRDVHNHLRQWLENARNSPDPSAQPKGVFARVSDWLSQAERALRFVPPALASTREWRLETAAYAQTLHELQAMLSHLDVILRVRRGRVANARTHMDAVRCWSELIKQIELRVG